MVAFCPISFSPSTPMPMWWETEDTAAAVAGIFPLYDCGTHNKETPDTSYQSTPVGGGGDGSSSSAKKLCHNAYERDRRKKLNTLYSSLRGLLPGTDHSKRMSIPSTISRVVKYIPELQSQVEKLTRRREELLLSLRRQDQEQQQQQKHVEAAAAAAVYPMISATCLDNMTEIMVQVCMPRRDVACKTSISRVLKALEAEGLQLMNASSFTTHDFRTFCSLHLEAKESIQMDAQEYCRNLANRMKKQAIST